MMINHDVNNTGYFTEAGDLVWLATCGVTNCVIGGSDWVTDQDSVIDSDSIEVELSDF